MDEVKYNNAKNKIQNNSSLESKFEKVEKIKSELSKLEIIENPGVSLFDSKNPRLPTVTVNNSFAANIVDSVKGSLSTKANNLLDEILNG
jgi:hypothetical protein